MHASLSFKNWVMAARHDWNRLGPKLPPWFRLRLSRIDARLVLQFMPPDTRVSGGVSAARYPHGVWAVCKRMRGTGLLFKRWVWAMSDECGIPQTPGMDTIRVLKLARDLWRRGKAGVLERQLDESLAAIRRARADESRAILREHIGNLCRKYDMSFGHNSVFFRDSSVAKVQVG